MTEREHTTGEIAAWVGLDWADQKHRISEYRVGSGEVVGYDLEHTPEALDEWIKNLRTRYGRSKIAVVLEQSRGAVLYGLMKYDGLILYPVNPLSVSNYRKTFQTSGAKSDPVDALVMAEMVRKHPDRFHPLHNEDTQTRTLQLLVESRRGLVNQMTRLTNRLTAELKQYFPQALKWAGELSSRQACEFLTQWPTLETLQMARGARLRKFYLAYGRPSKEAVEQRVAEIKKAVPLTTDEAVLLAGSMKTKALVDQIRALIDAIENYDDQIKQVFRRHPDRFIFDSFPGAGQVLAPRLLAAFGADRDRLQSAGQIQMLAGIAPVTESSGKSRRVHWRLACSKFLRQSFHEFAASSILWSDWAKAYHQTMRERGKGYNAAVRALAFKWLRVMFRCWKSKTAYDDGVYMESLKQRSPALFERASVVREERQNKAQARQAA